LALIAKVKEMPALSFQSNSLQITPINEGCFFIALSFWNIHEYIQAPLTEINWTIKSIHLPPP